MIIVSSLLFFFKDTPTTEIYTLSLHDALPICILLSTKEGDPLATIRTVAPSALMVPCASTLIKFRSEDHTSELQSQSNLVCRLLIEKKKKTSFVTSDHINTPVLPPPSTTQTPS